MLRLISTGDGDAAAGFGGASPDGTRAFFATPDAVPGTGDSDSMSDIYERRADGSLRLISFGGDNA